MTEPSGRQTTIIDTDPGIDDALAILLALASPGLRVLGLSTVAGNIGIETTTRNAGRLLALARRSDIPVFRGASAPLARPPARPLDLHGEDGLGGVALPEPERPPEIRPSVDWMADVLKAEPPGTVDLWALGPLTNLAALAQAHPGAARRIRRVLAMGGTVHEPGNAGPRSEFNIATDPEAAAVVLDARLPLTLIPLDVTRRVRATRAFAAGLAEAGSARSRVAASLIGAYFASTTGRESRPLHDPCVPLFALFPELFGCSVLRFRIEVGASPDAGALVMGEGASTSAAIALQVDAEGALERIRTGLIGALV